MSLTPDEKTLFNLAQRRLPESPIVFDIGAHKGDYTEFILSVLPNSDCYLFEANPYLFKDLTNKYNAFNYAVGSDCSNKQFTLCKDQFDELSSVYNRPVFEQFQTERVHVPGITVDVFCKAHNIDNISFLKIDTEGAEFDVLKGSESMLKKKKILFAQIEYGGTYPDADITMSEALAYISNLGYNAYELIGDSLNILSMDSFIEDYRYANFLITYLDL